VDDVREVRRDLRTALTLAGNIEIVGEAANGLEAVRLAESMDLEMPVIDGYAATRQIKAQCPACRVIALTVHGYESARRKAIESGVNDFVVKGVSLESLVKVISGPRR